MLVCFNQELWTLHELTCEAGLTLTEFSLVKWSPSRNAKAGKQQQNYSGSFIRDRAAAELHILCAKCCCSQEHNQLCTEWTDHQELLLHTELHFLLHNSYLCCLLLLLLLFSLSAPRPLKFLFIIKMCFHWEKLKRYCTHNQQNQVQKHWCVETLNVFLQQL